jgi:hypothetical protein
MSFEAIVVLFLGGTIAPVRIALVLIESTAGSAAVMANGKGTPIHEIGAGRMLLGE